MKYKINSILIIASFAFAMCLVLAASAQTSSFTYQGKLTDTSLPASGNYQFLFKLYDDQGSQVGPTVGDLTAVVTDGVFTVQLDFGSGAFVGGNRTLEISVRRNSGEAYVTLAPRQPITSVPYAVRAINAATAADAANSAALGGVPAANYLQQNGNGSQLTNLNAGSITAGTLPAARGGTGLSGTGVAGNFLRSNGGVWISNPILPTDIPSGSGNYIQNGTSPQNPSNFNISGNGTAGGTLTGNLINSNTYYQLNGQRIFGVGVGGSNLIAGLGAGSNNTGGQNSFFGQDSGSANSSGADNSFLGQSAGSGNTSGSKNSFVGSFAGIQSTTPNSGGSNAALGYFAGSSNTTGSGNTTIGALSDVQVSNLNNATAIGNRAVVGQSNSLVLGSINGVNGATADTKVGIGTTTPSERLTIQTPTGNYGFLHTSGAVALGSFIAPNAGWLGTKSNHPLNLFSNGVISMTLETNGLVRVPRNNLFLPNPYTVIITSPNGACWGITVNNAGALSTFSTTCP